MSTLRERAAALATRAADQADTIPTHIKFMPGVRAALDTTVEMCELVAHLAERIERLEGGDHAKG